MRRFLLLVFLALAGCHDLAGENGLSTGPRPRDTPGGLIVTNNPVFDYWMRLAPEDKQGALRTIDEVYAEVYPDQRQSPAGAHIAVMDGDLPNGAGAIIVQNLQSPDQPAFVVSGSAAGDEALILGITAFAVWRESNVRSPDRRVQWVTLPNSLPAFSIGHPVKGRRAEWPNVSGTLAERLRIFATSVTPIDIPGIGRGVLFRFD
jgi:hypothetical protein